MAGASRWRANEYANIVYRGARSPWRRRPQALGVALELAAEQRTLINPTQPAAALASS